MISTCILINYCILQDFNPHVDVSTEDVNCVREILCKYILKEAIDRKGKFYSGELWVYCDQNLETHLVFFSQVLLPDKPAWLAWLVSDTAWFRQFSHDSIRTNPNESNLKLDVILACLLIWSCLSINVILLCLYLWCENAFVVFPCCGGCHILAGSRMQPLMATKSWLVLGCRQQAGRLL
jgi:hypothetical protein